MGYYQNTEFDSEELKADWEKDTRPLEDREIDFKCLVRDISTKPRVTRFQIRWYVPFLVLVLSSKIRERHL